MNMDRRQALKTLGQACAGTAAVAASAGSAEAASGGPHPEALPGAVGMLYDTTRCIGCKACVTACSEANDLVPDTVLANGLWQMPMDLNAQTANIIKLYKEEDEDEDAVGTEYSYVKRQCMHCVDPACVAACPFKALTKDGENGIVMWEASQCIGCRYCQVACPFEVPKFEWQNFNPRIVKCQLCSHRLPEGKEPACCEVCPTDAVIYGTRQDLLEDAKSRIAAKPELYYEQRVYGEHDGGGTQVLYLSHVPFSAIGLPDLPDESIAWYGTWVHGILYKWLLIPLIVYGLMAAVIRKRWHEHEEEAREEAKKTGLPQQI
jgi:formate dehydrogenase beta subunit